MYICESCGEVKEELPCSRYYDRVDGNWAMSGWVEEEDKECSCGGTFVEATECAVCGEWINPKNGRICEDCLKAEMTLENAIEFSEKCGGTYNVELPDFFEIYTEKEIKEILIKHIMSTLHKEQRSVEEYCKEDISCFSDFIENKYN